MAGRLRIAHAVREALTEAGHVVSQRLPSTVTDHSPRRVLMALVALLVAPLRGRVLPVQCALFSDPFDLKAALARVPADAQAVYLDGVRTYAFLRLLRRSRPDLRIVVDMDDLMSRRMELLLSLGEPLSPGHLTLKLPPFLRRLVTQGALGRLIVLYEHLALKGVEREILRLADAVVLLSSEDAAELKVIARTGLQPRARILDIPGAIAPAIVTARGLMAPLRFIFVGTDALTQNRLTIDYLMQLWAAHRPPTPLVIYGQQTRGLHLAEGVTTPGYAPYLADIYDGRSILLAPSFLRGGVKTKVLEAMAWGAPVVGNAQTFESISLPQDYPLKLDNESGIEALIANPEALRPAFKQATAMGMRYILAQHDPAQVAARWSGLMRGERLSAGVVPPP